MGRPAMFNGRRPVSREPAKQRTIGGIGFERKNLAGLEGLMGLMQRSSITGEIMLQSMRNLPDFQVVDVQRRARLSGRLEELKQDKYLFKAYPLLHRTWIYHCALNDSVAMGTKYEENGLMKHVYAQPCIDAPTGGGRHSPVIYYVPLAIGTCLTGDQILVGATIALIAILLFISNVCNTPRYYERTRLFTLPLRLGYLVLVLALLDFPHFLAIAGFIANLGTMLLDFVLGDLVALRSHQLHCTYEILKVLPPRMMICHRTGAFRWEELFGKRGRVDECISGFGAWERSHHLIADIGDILVELCPLTSEDWQNLADQYFSTGASISCLALDAFDAPQTGDNDDSSSSSWHGGALPELRVEDM